MKDAPLLLVDNPQSFIQRELGDNYKLLNKCVYFFP
jgi:hypothetical protein